MAGREDGSWVATVRSTPRRSPRVHASRAETAAAAERLAEQRIIVDQVREAKRLGMTLSEYLDDIYGI